jgi:catechol 2,3-dioxygenase-like lactoylglutathione lyase family enzyme
MSIDGSHTPPPSAPQNDVAATRESLSRFRERHHPGRIRAAVLICLALVTSCDGGAPGQASGTLDHVGVAVQELDTAATTYANTFGFLPAQRTRLQNGIESLTFWFRDTTYLELLTYYDGKKARWVERFLEDGEGGIFFALRVPDLDRKAEHLRARGLVLDGPRAIPAQIDGLDEQPPEIFRVLLISEPLPAFPAFFISYNREEIERLNTIHPDLSPMRLTAHPNSAIGLRAVWMRVGDIDSALTIYRLMGFEPGRSLTMPVIGGTAREIPAGSRSILLIESAGRSGALAGMRSEGITGASIEVRNLDTTRALLQKQTHLYFDSYAGLFGESLLIPASMAHGIWLEFFEQKR